MPTAEEEKAAELAAFFNETFPGANARYAGADKDEDPHARYFELPGVQKRISIDEHAYGAWGGTKPMLKKAFEHDELIGQLDAGPGEYAIKKEGENIKVTRGSL